MGRGCRIPSNPSTYPEAAGHTAAVQGIHLGHPVEVAVGHTVLAAGIDLAEGLRIGLDLDLGEDTDHLEAADRTDPDLEEDTGLEERHTDPVEEHRHTGLAAAAVRNPAEDHHIDHPGEHRSRQPRG